MNKSFDDTRHVVPITRYSPALICTSSSRLRRNSIVRSTPQVRKLETVDGTDNLIGSRQGCLVKQLHGTKDVERRPKKRTLSSVIECRHRQTSRQESSNPTHRPCNASRIGDYFK
ncbi:uncharacterized protein LOC107264263 isoform X2 [Cephus cinctus]|uniref:Uncharacterized protein LOC107264263 isoform X2 n=1 Tax=Cephus cinctus TaxID=211228 RepID=A0AAJ7FEI1_CEPCN|nr:uncharacterized protein LOC107264263 isoform X2 [Cephus cinctus]